MRPPPRLIEAGAWALENGHRALRALTGGRFPRRLAGMQLVELHHAGRRSGLPRSTLLAAPILEPERVVLVASKGGHPDHPDWYKNLVASPDVELVAEGERRAVRARTADADERAQLWPQIVSAYRGYAGYQRNTDREIPVVILESRGPDRSPLTPEQGSLADEAGDRDRVDARRPAGYQGRHDRAG